MKGWMQVSVAGLLLFLATILVLLWVQGRMTYEGTRGIPILSLLFAPPEIERALDELEAGAGTSTPTANQDVDAEPAAADATGTAGADPAEATTPPAAPMLEIEVPQQFDYLVVDGGLTAAEIEGIGRRVREKEEEIDRRLAEVAQREADCAARERDLADRSQYLTLRWQRLEQAERDYDEKVEEFQALVIAIQQDEYHELLQLGRKLASFDLQTSVELVVGFWEDPESGRRDEIVKTLALMDNSAELRHAATKILGALPHERLRDILVERLKVVDLGGSAVPLRGNR